MAWMHELIAEAREDVQKNKLHTAFGNVDPDKLDAVLDLVLDELQRLRELITDTRDNAEWKKNR